MKQSLLVLLAFIVFVVDVQSIGPDRDFNYSKSEEAVFTTEPGLDLSPLKKIGEFNLFIAPSFDPLGFFPLITSHTVKPLDYYLSIYPLTTLRQYHLLI